MNDRDKIAKIIREARINASPMAQLGYPEADALIERGMILLPCKVGKTLYFLYDRTYANRPDLTPRIYETNQWYFDVDEKGISILPRSIHGCKGKYHYYLGETVFLTREEAEKKLEEMRGNEQKDNRTT